MRRVYALLIGAGVWAAAPASNGVLAQLSSKEIAAIEAADNSRFAAAVAGDLETARSFIAPEFLFVHTTGDINDLKEFEAFTRRIGRTSAEPPRQVSPPVYRVVGDVVIRTRLTASPPRPDLPDAQFRSLDVFTNRNGRWLWLAHQGAMVAPPWRGVSIDATLLGEYAGTYATNRGEVRSYEARDGKLVQLRSGANPADISLLPVSDYAFAVEHSATTHTFLRDRSGRVAQVQVIGTLGLTTYRRQ